MIIELVMKCFRKHEDRTINFLEGLNAIRGPNEAGKTTMQLAIMYALWGVKALPEPLDDMVTWGRPAKDLRVRLTIRVYGELYQFERHKNGAECRFNGETVTGQNEVTTFATKLLGANKDLATKLMFASQGGLRGALDSGATALSKYIEDLSGMDLFDVLMDLIGDKLSTGPTATLDQTVARLEETLQAGAPVPPDTDAVDGSIHDAEAEVKRGQDAVVVHEATATAAAEALTAATAKAAVKVQLEDTMRRVRESLDRRVTYARDLETTAAMAVDPDRIGELTAQLDDEKLIAARLAVHKAYTALKMPEDVWEGDEASLKAEVAQLEKTAQTARTSLAGLSADIREAKAKLTTSSVCGFCDQDMAKFPEVAKRNAELQTLISEKELGITNLKQGLATTEGDLTALQGVLAAATPFQRFLLQHGDFVEADLSQVPPILTWKGSVPTAGANAAAMQKELAALTKVRDAVAVAKVQLEQVRKEIAADNAEYTRLQTEALALPEADSLEPLRQAKTDADISVSDARRFVTRSQAELSNLKQLRDRAMIEFNLKLKAHKENSVRLGEARAERDTLVFNNNLVKKVKSARPIVAAKLWTTILAAVSTMFTKMRGEASVVTKVRDDFHVNGKSVVGLSGSTLDLLGLSIRVALVKSFIPACSFMLLDEAMAACDDERTASLLGFISAAGFEQVLMITHEDISTTCASNLVTV